MFIPTGANSNALRQEGYVEFPRDHIALLTERGIRELQSIYKHSAPDGADKP